MNLNIQSIKALLYCIFIGLSLFSCRYQDIRDAEYPENVIYLPTAINGIYLINSANQDSISPVTSGSTFKYKIDQQKNQFIIPLGIYCSGVRAQGAFTVMVKANSDTIATLLKDAEYKEFELISANNLTFPDKINFTKNQQDVTFDLSIDLNYLKANLTKKYLFAITISSSDVPVNPKLATTIIDLDPKFLSKIIN